ncbi:unnamed protein product [Amoebophrya sp. A120]|nr:unnamed protein product [Amoebophrya sp. A120]|eukprot:GSA120T00016961001.1
MWSPGIHQRRKVPRGFRLGLRCQRQCSGQQLGHAHGLPASISGGHLGDGSRAPLFRCGLGSAARPHDSDRISGEVPEGSARRVPGVEELTPLHQGRQSGAGGAGRGARAYLRRVHCARPCPSPVRKAMDAPPRAAALVKVPNRRAGGGLTRMERPSVRPVRCGPVDCVAAARVCLFARRPPLLHACACALSGRGTAGRLRGWVCAPARKGALRRNGAKKKTEAPPVLLPVAAFLASQP